MSNELVIRTQEDVVSFANKYIIDNNIIPNQKYNVPRAMVSLFNNVLNVKDKNGKSVLETCTQESIQNAVYTCINKELTPSKNQSYFIPYGNKLTQMDSYFGLQKMVKDTLGYDTFAEIVREGDSFKIKNRPNGTKVVQHQINAKSIFENKPIIGAYAVASDPKTKEVINSEIMSIKDINISLSKTKTGGLVQKEFREEMTKKVPLKRLCKHLLNITGDERYDDINYIETDYTINANDDETIEYTEEDVITSNSLELELDQIDDIPEDAIEISYAEYKNNSDKYSMVKGSYNKATKTCKVIKLNTEEGV